MIHELLLCLTVLINPGLSATDLERFPPESACDARIEWLTARENWLKGQALFYHWRSEAIRGEIADIRCERTSWEILRRAHWQRHWGRWFQEMETLQELRELLTPDDWATGRLPGW